MAKEDFDLKESEEEEEEEGEEEDGDEEILQAEPRPDAVYNAVALQEKLEDIRWPSNLDWMHNLSITVEQSDDIDVNDDLAREMTFYTQALEGTREAYKKLQEKNIPFLRPEDYYAEMVKTDSHMLKVKDKLLFQHKKIEDAEERRKARDAKKFAKEVQAQTLMDRAKKKKQEFDSVKKWRKMRKNSGFTKGEDEFPVDFEAGPATKKAKVVAWDRSGGKGGKLNFQKRRGPAKKTREFRNAKFGHGGKKSFNKKNTAESSADVSGFKGFKKGKNRK